MLLGGGLGGGVEKEKEKEKGGRGGGRERDTVAEEMRGNVKKGDKKKEKNDQYAKAEIRSMNENTRREGKEREGGSELIKGLCCRDKAEQHPG